MKQTIRITSTILETTLAARTIIGGREMVLTTDWHQLTAEAYATDATLKTKQLMDQEFTASRRWFEYTFDTKDPVVPPKPKVGDPEEVFQAYNEAMNAFDINKRKRDATREFWGKHRQIKHLTNLRNGFTPDLNPVATLEVTSQTELDNHLKDRKYFEIFNRVINYSDQELLDCCLYYKPVLYGKTKGQMLHGLLSLAHVGTDKHFLSGALYQEGIADDFLNNYNPENSTVAMKIYVSKAMMMGIIVPTTGGYSLINGTFVGKDVDSAVVYFNADMQSYTNIIQPEVNAKSKLPEDDMADYVAPWSVYKPNKANKATDQAVKDAASLTDYYSVKKQYEDLGGRASLSTKEMREWVANKHLANEQIKTTESLPTTALEIELEPWKTDDLNKLKELGKRHDVTGWYSHIDDPNSKEKLRVKIKEKMTAKAV